MRDFGINSRNKRSVSARQKDNLLEYISQTIRAWGLSRKDIDAVHQVSATQFTALRAGDHSAGSIELLERVKAAIESVVAEKESAGRPLFMVAA